MGLFQLRGFVILFWARFVCAFFEDLYCLEKLRVASARVLLSGYHLFFIILRLGFWALPFALFLPFFYSYGFLFVSLVGENLYHEAWIPLEIMKHLLNHHWGFFVFSGVRLRIGFIYSFFYPHSSSLRFSHGLF